jgi:hypothetical protein
MSRHSWLAAAAAVAFTAACAGSDAGNVAESTSAGTANTMAPSAAPAPMHTPQATTFTDAQLRSFAAATQEINPIAGTLSTATPEQRATATEQIRGILARNEMDVDTYNAIAAQARSDPALVERIRSLAH